MLRTLLRSVRAAGPATALAVALGAGVIGANAIAVKPSAEAPVRFTPDDGVMAGPVSFADIAELVKPAVVNISIVGNAYPLPRGQFRGPQFPPGSPFERYFRDFFGNAPGTPDRRMTEEFRAVGSGFVISAEGLVVTNNHVIERAEEIEVIMQDGTRHAAAVKGRDPKTDLALLEIDVDGPLPFVELGDSDAARIGDWVLAVGNPFGLGGTVTAGIISARGRDIQSGPYDDFLQVDAPINRGNSGGPLFDANGQVIGINTAIYSPSGGSVGIGFAIPSSLARDVLAELEESGTVERGWLGVEFQPVNEAVAESLGLGQRSGALVVNVVDDGPADTAGIEVGDVILGVDGEAVDAPKDLPRLIARARAGTTVEIEVLRNGTKRRLDVEIGRADAVELAGRAAPSGEGGQLGVRLSKLTPELKARYGTAENEGVVVTEVQGGSPASKAGIRPGNVITMVGQTAVRSPGDVVAEVDRAARQGRPSVLLLLEQGGARRFVAVDLAA